MRMILFLILCQLFCFCSARDQDDLFLPARNVGKISEKLDEASGLVTSVKNSGKLWSINDSGNDAAVFLINDHAKIDMICTLKGAENRDWEEIANGPGPIAGVNYLYVGDIGDNNARYDLKYIFRFPEPTFKGQKKIEISQFDTLVFKLPDGPRDTEAMMVDPITRDLFIVSKREQSVHLYQAHAPFAPHDTIVMQKVASLQFKLIVGASISADGQEVLLKNYNKIFYWKRAPGESIADLLQKDPVRLTYEPEHQGESIAWARDGSGYYTLSESSVVDRAWLRFYQRK